jgi:PAS domain S-box-containing protein
LRAAFPTGGSSRIRVRSYAAAIAIACLGVGLSIYGFKVARRGSADEKRSLFRDSAGESTAWLGKHLASHDLVLTSLRAFYSASEFVSREEFRDFTAAVLARHGDIQALVWIPVVTEDDLDGMEREAALSGLPGFKITRPGEHDPSVSPAESTEYLPALYVSGGEINRHLLGIDWGGIPELRSWFDRARDGGGPVTVRVPQAVWGGEPGPVLATILAVYEKGAWVRSADDRRRHVEGFLAEVYQPRQVLQLAIPDRVSHATTMRMVRIEDDASGEVLYEAGAALSTLAASDDEIELAEVDGALYGAGALHVGGTKWTVIFTPGPGLESLGRTSSAWLVFVAGLALTGGIVAYLITVTRRSAEISWYARELLATQTELEHRLAENLVAQKTLNESERFLRVTFDTVSTGIVVIDPATHTIVDANRAAAVMVGARKEHMVGSCCHEFICSGTPGVCPVTDRGEVLDNAECYFLNASEDKVPCLRTVVPITFKGKKHLLDCMVDISAQKHAQTAAERESAKLSAMISHMEEGVVFADAHNVITKVNDYFCRFIGKTSDQILGRTIADFHPGNVMEHVDHLIRGFRSNLDSEPFTMQRRIVGSEVLLRMQPIYREGCYDGVLLNVIDVSELVTARRMAEEAARTKGEFLANMSHEIRTPMTAVMGYADLLADPRLETEDRLEYVNIIQRNGAHLLTLINDILDLSKIEAGRLSIEKDCTELLDLLADIASTMRARARERNTDLVTECPTRLPRTIRTDRARLHQVLVNLVGNAVKFTSNGSVRIRTLFLPEWRGKEPAVRFEVIDTGIGIDKDALPRLFEPFVQADSSTSRKYGGTGLGLTISARIVDLLDGEISASSEAGKGSTFAVTIPTGNLTGVEMIETPAECLVERARGPAREFIDGDVLKGLRVLVAEDGPDNQRLIKTLLAQAGATVTLVEDGSAAVDAVARGIFDVVLMDLQMPSMDGYEATRTLRGRGYKIPILALTAHAMAADRQKSLAAGCDDHITKPINRGELIMKVAQWTRDRAQSGEGKSEAGGGEEVGPAPSSDVAPLVSEYAGDPALAEILGDFVSALSGRVRAMTDAHTNGDLDELQRLAHQLKGAGGSYGYPMLTEAAAGVEAACEKGDREEAGVGLELLDRLSMAITAGFGSMAASPTGA